MSNNNVLNSSKKELQIIYEKRKKDKWNVCEHCDPYIINDGTCDNCRFEEED